MSRNKGIAIAAIAALGLLLPVTGVRGQATRFTVRVETVASAGTLALRDGSVHPAVIHPGAWFLYRRPQRETAFGTLYQASSAFFSEPRTIYGIHYPAEGGLLFTPGRADRGQGLRELVHDGDPLSLNAALAKRVGVLASGTFGPSPANNYEFTFSAEPGSALTFAFKVGDSGCLCYSPREGAIALFDGNRPISGDVTSRIALWDGEFIAQTPGGHRQSIHRLDDTSTFAAAVGRVIRVVVQPATVVGRAP